MQEALATDFINLAAHVHIAPRTTMNHEPNKTSSKTANDLQEILEAAARAIGATLGTPASKRLES